MRKYQYKCVFCLCLVLIVISGCKKEPTSKPVLPRVEQTTVETASVQAKILSEPVMQANEYTDYVSAQRLPQTIKLICGFAETSPVIDGVPNEGVWDAAVPITTLDFSSQRPIKLRSFHDGEMIYFLVTFPDEAPSEAHKSWFWDKDERVYKPGNDREDMFVLKWKMSGDSISFSPDIIEPHTADMWFWKCCRTNPSGYLDDKVQSLTVDDREETTPIQSDKYETLYLFRQGDAGKSAYVQEIFFEYQGDYLLKYYPREPEGSRADIRGKGRWENGMWTLEIARKLDTGHDDDVALSVGQTYEFGACLYEMSGIPQPEDMWFQPLYRTGNVFDTLILVVQ